MKKSKKIIFLITIFLIILISSVYFYNRQKMKKIELESKMPYNFETLTLPEVKDFSDIATNYAKTLKKVSLYETEELLKEKVKVEEEKYLEVFGYKDGISKVKFEDKFYFVKSSNIENVSKNKLFKVIKGILLVNTEYKLPSDFNLGFDKFVEKQFDLMKVDANRDRITLDLHKGFISYEEQKQLNKNAPKNDKYIEYAMYSSAGHNESQIGQSLDIIGKDEEKNLKESFKETEEFKWLIKNAHKYGFILRYPENKEDKTNYKFEPWHFRFVGVENANKIFKKNITLEEFLRQ